MLYSLLIELGCRSPLFRGQETCAPHTPSKPLHIPGLNKGLGGYRSLTARQQFQLQQYPPPFPTAQKSQATPGTTLPGSTTYGFGYNFDLARRCSNYNVTPYQKQYRPDPSNGDSTKLMSSGWLNCAFCRRDAVFRLWSTEESDPSRHEPNPNKEIRSLLVIHLVLLSCFASIWMEERCCFGEFGQ